MVITVDGIRLTLMKKRMQNMRMQRAKTVIFYLRHYKIMYNLQCGDNCGISWWFRWNSKAFHNPIYRLKDILIYPLQSNPKILFFKMDFRVVLWFCILGDYSLFWLFFGLRDHRLNFDNTYKMGEGGLTSFNVGYIQEWGCIRFGCS